MIDTNKIYLIIYLAGFIGFAVWCWMNGKHEGFKEGYNKRSQDDYKEGWNDGYNTGRYGVNPDQPAVQLTSGNGEVYVIPLRDIKTAAYHCTQPNEHDLVVIKDND